MDKYIGETEYWEYASDIVTTMITRATIFSFLALGLGIALALVCKRKKLFLREHRIWNILTKLFYAYVPVVFLVVGLTLGVINGGHSAANHSIDKICQLSKAVIPSFREYLETDWDNRNPNDMTFDESVSQFLSNYYYQPKSDGFFENRKAKIVNYFTLNAGKWILTTLVSVAVLKAGDAAGIAEDDVESAFQLIRDMDLSEIDRNFLEIFSAALKKTIGEWFGSLYTGALLKLLLLLMPIGIEFAFYRYWRRKRALPSEP